MDQINLQPEDKLYVLGDVVDRYPFGIEILQKIMRMPNAYMLKGNHEVMLEYAAKTGRKQLWYMNGGDLTDEAYEALPVEQQKEIVKFIETLPINIDIEVNDKKYKLVHGSPKEWCSKYHNTYKTAEEFAVWERVDPYAATDCDYVTVFGHTPTIYYQAGRIAEIYHGHNVIGVDCGSGFKSTKKHIFRLGCLRLDDMAEFYSEENI